MVINIPTLLSGISIGTALFLAILQWKRYLSDKKLHAQQLLEGDFKAPAERDQIIVAAAQEAVGVLKAALLDIREDNAKLRQRIDELQARVYILEAEVNKRECQEECCVQKRSKRITPDP